MKYSSTTNGFSLVETLVSIAILLIIIIGPMTISSSAARSTSFSSEQVIAYFLAQEGAELAQRARDNLILIAFPASAGALWGVFSNDSTGPYADCYINGCGLEINEANEVILTPVSCSANDCRLYYNDDEDRRSFYTYTDTGSSTPYTRVVTFELAPGGDEVHVTSKVTWRTGSQRNEQEAVVETYLFNVYGN